MIGGGVVLFGGDGDEISFHPFMSLLFFCNSVVIHSSSFYDSLVILLPSMELRCRCHYAHIPVVVEGSRPSSSPYQSVAWHLSRLFFF